ncbi:MAG: TonB-dependent receptor [Gemmatimonadaceae bacterium]|nr:TonB-dependent receptor [Gemmatimonadaceae bacterium]
MRILPSGAAPALIAFLLTAATVPAETLRGTVVDASTGDPLPGAHLTHGDLVVTADADGRFELSLAAGDSALVTHVGYGPAVVRPRPGAVQPVTVRLLPAAVPVPETVVTGGLIEQALAEVASSVTVLDRGRLADSGGDHLHELIPAVANLNWSGGTSRPRYYQIRGIGERSHYAGEGPPSFSVGFVMDDVDLSGLGMAGLLHDLDQAEVFKGPQSTLFGPNAMAGLINLRSTDPAPTAGGEATLAAGSDGLLRYAGTVNLPAGERWAARVGYSSGRTNGFRENRHLGIDDSNGREETLARAKVAYEGDGLRLVGTLFRADLDNGYDAWAPDNNEDLATWSDNLGKDSQTTDALSLRARAPLPGSGAELVSITSFSRTDLEHSYDGDWGNDDFWKQDPYGFDPEEQGWSYDFFDRNLRERSTFTQEIRLRREDPAGGGGLVAGAYLKSLAEEDDAAGYLFGGDATDLQSRFEISDLAFYGQYGRALSGRWHLTLNGRVDRNATSYEGSTNNGAEQVEFDVAQWLPGGKAALAYRPAPDRNLYAAVSRGFRAGGVNQHPRLASASRPFDPEYVLNLEVGYRASGPRTTTALTLFHALRSDQQVELSSQQDPGDPNSFFYFTANAVTGRSTGVEWEQSLRLRPDLRLTASLGLLDTYVDTYTFPIGEGEEESLGDRAGAHAPRYTFRLGGEYRHPSGLGARLALSGADRFYFSESHDQESEPYQLVDAQLSWDRGIWSLQLWGRNLLDARYAVRGFFFGLEPPDYADKLYKSYGDPRQVGLRLTARLPAGD